MLLLTLGLELGCGTAPRPSVGTNPSSAEALAFPVELIPYPRAGWRLASEEALDGVLVWPAHILIRHAEADAKIPFTLLEWRASEPAPRRSRAQAVALADRLAARAAAHPGEFAALAAEYSEDAPTRSHGGELGGLRASDLLNEPEVLDALAALSIGQISRPVESSHGIHILRRDAPPSRERVAGRRIVIGHTDADWEGSDAQRPQRTLVEARDLARQVHEAARRDPDGFDALARQSSDWHDVDGGSELGSWSPREANVLGRELAVLQKLPVGGVAPPLEGPLGVEILLRTHDPKPEPQWRDAELELPALVRPELETMLGRLPPRVVVRELDAVLVDTSLGSGLTPDQSQLLAELRARSVPVHASTPARSQSAAFADSLSAFLAASTSSPLRLLLEDRLALCILNARILRFQRKLAM